MSNLIIINNAEKIIQTCNTYQFGYAGANPSDTGIVDFINCDDINTRVALTWEESDGRYYNITICAKEILNISSFVTDEGIIGSCDNTQDFVPQSQYNISIEFTCTDNGWENGATGGTATCQGIKTVKISDLLGVANGFIRFQYINNSNEVGLTKEDGSQLNIGEVLPISQMLMATTYAQCSNVYPCTPFINSGTYIIQYSPNGMDNWINSNLNVI